MHFWKRSCNKDICTFVVFANLCPFNKACKNNAFCFDFLRGFFQHIIIGRSVSNEYHFDFLVLLDYILANLKKLENSFFFSNSSYKKKHSFIRLNAIRFAECGFLFFWYMCFLEFFFVDCIWNDYRRHVRKHSRLFKVITSLCRNANQGIKLSVILFHNSVYDSWRD